MVLPSYAQAQAHAYAHAHHGQPMSNNYVVAIKLKVACPSLAFLPISRGWTLAARNDPSADAIDHGYPANAFYPLWEMAEPPMVARLSRPCLTYDVGAT